MHQLLPAVLDDRQAVGLIDQPLAGSRRDMKVVAAEHVEWDTFGQKTGRCRALDTKVLVIQAFSD